MALRHYNLLLTGAVQRLSQVLPGMSGSNAAPSATDDIPYRQVRLQAVPANAAVVYVGASSSVSSTDHGGSLDPTQATAVDSMTLGPFETGPIKLSDLYVIGTNNDRVAVIAVPF